MKKLSLQLLIIAIFILALNTLSVEQITPKTPILFMIQTLAYLWAMSILAWEIVCSERNHTHKKQ